MESPLVRGCTREAMRLYPVAPFIGRFVDLNAEIGGYLIPKGTLVLASLYTSGRDPLNFSDPNKFIPQRWLRDESCEHKVFKSHASIPFAMGSRSCVGKKIALYQIHSLVTKVTQHSYERRWQTWKLGNLIFFLYYFQILQQFTLESRNKEEVEFKLKLIGVPDKKILIAFRKMMPWRRWKS